METKAVGRRPGSKNYSKAFRAMVVAQSNDPARSIADVAQEHGLNANMIARWRRAREPAQPIPQAQPAETFIPVHLPIAAPQTSSIVVECGAVRVRFDGPLDLNALWTVLATLRSSS
ncbi:IS66-like element accessory protein TnpA [Paraburkholderia susongensis]|uniref:IS66-like element accessory protein TnpA n=1 Tax=Paraburkholderia susongensis TaxID=1515439 RepID=UPI000A1C9354|nr:transposase [Paraburkholderia susongensis]